MLLKVCFVLREGLSACWPHRSSQLSQGAGAAAGLRQGNFGICNIPWVTGQYFAVLHFHLFVLTQLCSVYKFLASGSDPDFRVSLDAVQLHCCVLKKLLVILPLMIPLS